MNWLRRMIGLPEGLARVIQDTVVKNYSDWAFSSAAASGRPSP